MRVKKNIDLNLIEIDRLPLDEKTLLFAQIIQTEGRDNFPAIKIAKKSDGRFEIRDGRHRWLAHKLTGQSKILAKFSEETLRK